MANVKIELNKDGLKQLMQGAEMQTGLINLAQAASGRAGEGYGHNVSMGRDRVTVFVKAETREAIKDNLENNTILRSLQG